MKKLIYLLAYCFFIVITACGGNKKAEEKSLLIMQDSVDARGLQRMQVSKADVDIKFKGKDYHTFTKRNFVSIVGEDFLAKSILEGMVYNKTTPQGIVYAASVCYPQTDLYVPISITITADGKMTMAREELLEEIYDEEGV